jgi:CBS-domain-containing membrane protein
VTQLAGAIDRKVDLNHPDKLVRVDVVGERAAISVLRPGEVFSAAVKDAPQPGPSVPSSEEETCAMRVEELMTKTVRCCAPDDSLEHAARLMWEYDCGCLPVCAGTADGAGLTAVITDRDICMHAFFQEKPLRELRVRDAMSKRVCTCQPGDSLEQAERLMRDARVRRLPVVDPKGALVGMISLADLAREAAREDTLPRKDVTEGKVGEMLAAICTPAAPVVVAQPMAA